MKKYGKYEKRPEGVPEKQPKVKSALLQTYFTSLLCMVLCVTMFFGTSYAWFTSEVNNTANEIYIGTLDVGLFAGDKDLSDNNSKLFDANIRWEPGYTALETITVINEGDLAFKYVLSFTDGSLAEESALSIENVAKYFDVWVYDHRDNSGNAPAPASYAEIATENSGWVPAGSLDELLAGKTVLDGVMVTVRDNNSETSTNEGTTDGVATEDTYTIALHMKEDADVAVMGQRITLNVKLVAYQMASEQDDLGSRYDQMVATEDQLKEAMENGGMVALAADIKLTEGLTVASDKTVILDLNGHKITGTASVDMTSLITNSGTLDIVGDGEIAIITDVEINDSAVNTISNRGILTINGGKVSNTGRGSQIGYGIDNYNGATLTVNGGEINATGSSSYDGIRLFCGSNETTVTINGGKISSIWAQNPSNNKANEVKGTVILNGGEVTTTYYENYTTVKVKSDVTATVTPYGAGSDNITTETADGYTVYSFVH